MAVSKRQRLIDDINRMIGAGELRPSDRLPSARELRESYDVSSTVVREAVNWLKAQGVVVGAPGIGVFVAGEPPDEGDGGEP